MIFSGINSREIARKNEVSFRVNVRPSNISGKAEIGFSGVGGIPVRFHLESGFVYDRPTPSQVGDFVTAYDSLWRASKFQETYLVLAPVVFITMRLMDS
jgi:hypothetical protein